MKNVAYRTHFHLYKYILFFGSIICSVFVSIAERKHNFRLIAESMWFFSSTRSPVFFSFLTFALNKRWLVALSAYIDLVATCYCDIIPLIRSNFFRPCPCDVCSVHVLYEYIFRRWDWHWHVKGIKLQKK